MKPPRKFVKYRNRKFHEVGSEDAYVSLEDVGRIVSEGHEVEILDDVTGEDITVATLARILYDVCREDSTVVAEAQLRKLIVEATRAKKAAA